MFRIVSNVAAVAAIALTVGAASWAVCGGPPAKTMVSVDELGERVILIGRLGKPLAQMMTLRGSWAYPENKLVKDYSLIFTVTHVDEQPLARPVSFNIARVSAVRRDGAAVEPTEGADWTLRAYEAGDYLEVPMAYWEESGRGVPGLPSWFGRFVPKLVGIVQ